MLVLSRHKNERIKIKTPDGTMIDLVVCDVRGDKVRLGISAPDSFTVHRQEVWNAIERTKGNGSGESAPA